MLNLLLISGFNLLRLVSSKLRFGSRYQSPLFQRIHPLASIRLFHSGKIRLKHNIEIAPYTNIQVHGRGQLSIGARVYINRYCMVSCHDSISIGDGCMFGPGVKVFDNNHRFNKSKGVQSSLNIGTISIGNNCWIASNAIILKGAKIGNNCIIGAGCIIDYEIHDNSIVRLKQTHSVQAITK